MIAMILAGGSGTRLWPYSRSMTPKQFLNLGQSHESLLQETYRRLEGLVTPKELWIIGATLHEFELRRQVEQMLPSHPSQQILLEPCAKNTAPAILWGLACIPKNQRQVPLAILPADHLISDGAGFREKLLAGAQLAQEGWIVTFGIQPDRPDTGYGYIKAAEAVGPGFKVAQFAEKPNLATAQAYLASGTYSWNAGIFMATAQTLLDQYKKLAPNLYQAFFEGDEPRREVSADLVNLYQSIQPDSFDYAILEKSDQVAVVNMSVGWNDLGSWESIYQVSEKDAQGNVTKGNVILKDSENCLIFSDKRLVTGVGIKNLILIETEDALLACDLSHSQGVKALVEQLKKEDRFEYKFHNKVVRPWGAFWVLKEGPNYKVKRIQVEPGKRLSLQRHLHRSEHWVVIAGTAKVTRNDEILFLTENQSTYLPKTAVHRLENPGKSPVEIIEVQMGDYVGEDDIERLEDDYARDSG
ncbi:MAG: mannose-1-phosphate guanylyltransferase/mannose-6-phosphate isomerase [Candidatus Lambdaproteobacteria bacterium RIFOXYD2_FULL_50_16]|uniref:mannose-1-phosphate guanylyltransferase n=1 Tax=Candidatus Lambdaproteobacteria bacterium RIFOXYD2_FULL_50_16 TaxID=1817772 RepID=A0A1F6GFJ2_9PROT|nr:MAG: mannose-1-phosphate guanylyltransferase/mannose-6-phosphate isomerase [Candidatus Lambdaproteobacteria bacterium RIFOXYD2_FULL_50_16]